MKRTLYPLVAGTYTAIPALQFARRVEFNEDATGNRVGLQMRFKDDNYTQVHKFPPDQEPVVMGDAEGFGIGQGQPQGWPVQTGLQARAADTYAFVTCLTGTTILRVTEYD